MTEPTVQTIAEALIEGPFDQTPPELQARLLAKAVGIADAIKTAPPPPANVIEALARVEAELPGIGKDQRASEQQGGYAYRGIEAITAHAGALLGRYGVVFVPKINSAEPIDLIVNNKPWVEWRCLISYTVYGPGGRDDFIEVGPFLGLGRDNSDKGVNKAMTQAFKYALIQTLCIGDKADEADGTTAATDSWGREMTPEEQARKDGWASVADYSEHYDRLTAVVDALDEQTRNRFWKWMSGQGIELPGPKAGWEVAYAKAVEKANPGKTVTPDPISGGPVAEPVLTDGEPPPADDEEPVDPAGWTGAPPEDVPDTVVMSPFDTPVQEPLSRAEVAAEALAAAENTAKNKLRDLTDEEIDLVNARFQTDDPMLAAVRHAVGGMSERAINRQLAAAGYVTDGDLDARKRRLAMVRLLERIDKEVLDPAKS